MKDLPDVLGVTLPEPLTKEQQTHAATAYLIIRTVHSPDTARAWMLGLNPHLDQAPILAVQAGRGPDVITAARTYLEGAHA